MCREGRQNEPGAILFKYVTFIRFFLPVFNTGLHYKLWWSEASLWDNKSFLDTRIRIKKNPKPTTTKPQTQKRQESQLNFTVKFPTSTSGGVKNAVCWTTLVLVEFSGIFWSVEFP